MCFYHNLNILPEKEDNKGLKLKFYQPKKDIKSKLLIYRILKSLFLLTKTYIINLNKKVNKKVILQNSIEIILFL